MSESHLPASLLADLPKLDELDLQQSSTNPRSRRTRVNDAKSIPKASTRHTDLTAIQEASRPTTEAPPPPQRQTHAESAYYAAATGPSPPRIDSISKLPPPPPPQQPKPRRPSIPTLSRYGQPNQSTTSSHGGHSSQGLLMQAVMMAEFGPSSQDPAGVQFSGRISPVASAMPRSYSHRPESPSNSFGSSNGGGGLVGQQQPPAIVPAAGPQPPGVPTTIAAQVARKDVIALRDSMHATLTRLGAANPHHEYPFEIRSLLRLAEDENVIYDGVFNEMVRQVTVHMIERGDLLAEIRKRYANMFAQIPKVVKNLYGELCAERVMNRRLAGELLRTRDSVKQLGDRLVAIQRAESMVSAQGTDARDQLLEVLARTEHVDETLAEYHALYRMQRKRLEMQIRHMDQERKVWVDAATHLALRIGSEHGLPDVAVLQKYEYGRLRAVNHMISLLGGFDRSEVQRIESRADAWVKDMIDRAKDIEREDNKCVSILQKALREVRSLQKMLEIDDTSDGAGGAHDGGGGNSRGRSKGRPTSSLNVPGQGGHSQQRARSASRGGGGGGGASRTPNPPMHPWEDPSMTPDPPNPSDPTTSDPNIAMDRARNMLLFETRSSVDMIKKWAEATNQVSTRYTSDRDEHILEQLTNAHRGLAVWVGLAVAVLQRTEKSTARKEYLELQTRLTLLQEELEGWIHKLRTKVSGDDGIASAVIALQNQIEDRYAVFAGVRDRERAISTMERFMLRESLGSWQEQLGILIVMMSSSSGSEEKRLPLNVENWLTKLMDQLNNDTELRNDENIKLHNSLVRWMVQLLIKTGRQAPDKSWDQELTQLELEINELNKMLIKDAGDMEVLSDDRKDLRLVANSYSNAWLRTARRLLESQKRASMVQIQQRRGTMLASHDTKQQPTTSAITSPHFADIGGSAALDPVPETTFDSAAYASAMGQFTSLAVSKGLADALGSRELDVLTSAASRVPSRRNSLTGSRGLARRSSQEGNGSAGGLADGGGSGGGGANMIKAAVAAVNITQSLLAATSLNPLASAPAAAGSGSGASLTSTSPAASSTLLGAGGSGRAGQHGSPAKQQLGLPTGNSASRRPSTAAEAMASAVATMAELNIEDAEDMIREAGGGDDDDDSDGGAPGGGEEAMNEILEFDSYYLEQGKDGTGSYPDVTDVPRVAIADATKDDLVLMGGVAPPNGK